MNTPQKDGGPAFPSAVLFDAAIVETGGMTLRDWFAALAPASEIESCMPETARELAEWLGIETYTWAKHYPMAMAKARMVWADAMLAARKAPSGLEE